MRPEYNVREIYVGDGLTNLYTFDFKVTEKEHLLVLHLDATNNIIWEVRATDTTYFTTVLNNEDGYITLLANLPTNHRMFLLLADDAPTQPSKYTTSDKYTLKKIEKTFDFLSGQIQRIRYLLDRSFKFPEKIATAEGELPEVVDEGVPLIKYDSGTQKWYVVVEPRTSFIGPPGPPGPNVVDSANRLKITRIASEDIQKGDALTSDSATHVSLADASTTRQMATVIGFAEHNALTGQNVDITLFGVLSDPIFSIFSLDDSLFLDEDGGVTDTLRTSGFHTVCGFSLGGNEIFVRISPPIQLGA